jgi:hypothetical protein
MAHRRHLLVLVACALLTTACPSCNDQGEIEGLDLGSPTTVAPPLDASPTELTFTHVVRESDCPQVIGRIRVRHRGDASFLYRVSTGAPIALRFGSQLMREREILVARGAEEEVEVVFDCNSQASPVIRTVTFRDGNGQVMATVQVSGIVR